MLLSSADISERIKNDNGNVDEVVSSLQNEIAQLQRRLVKAVVATRGQQSSGGSSGFARVEFVQTKPSRWKKGSSGGKTILHPFRVDFPEGCVTALMGPSGAGKTTLLDFVTGTLGKSVLAKGEVCLPDNDAYVPQDDRLHTFYTCRAYMEHYARLSGLKPLCCGSSKTPQKPHDSNDEENIVAESEDDIDERITTILHGVGLSSQENTIVGGIFTRGLSGGQKRRLSVALEALSSPLNLYLDEPTSGLDSESALRLMRYLREYASTKCPVTGLKRRVILTIHQPSSFIWELIDNVVLLADGHLIYQGPRLQMEAFFSEMGSPTPMNFNPADHYIQAIFSKPSSKNDDIADLSNYFDIWSKKFEEWCEETLSVSADPPQRSDRATTDNRLSVVTRSNPNISLFPRKRRKYMRLRVSIELSRRYFVNLAMNPGVLGLRIVIYVGLSLVLGILFFHLGEDLSSNAVAMSRPALLYFIVAFFTSMAVAAVPFALIERAIVDKEVRNSRYHPVFYHAAQALASIPGCFLLAFLSTIIIMSMTKLNGPTFFGLNIFLLLNCAEATAQLIAHICSDFVAALALLSGLFGIFTLLMGFLVVPSDFPTWLRWSYNVPCMTYSFRSLMNNEFKDQEDFVNPFMSCYNDFFNNETALSPSLQGVLGEDFLFTQQEISEVCNLPDTSSGNAILRLYEMDNVNEYRDMMVLILWAGVVHIVSFAYLHYAWLKGRRIFEYTDTR